MPYEGLCGAETLSVQNPLTAAGMRGNCPCKREKSSYNASERVKVAKMEALSVQNPLTAAGMRGNRRVSVKNRLTVRTSA
ncbi:hypothetical protein PAECIP111893_01364 [Paenibacillus plantiphilus]|uniref:Uncharacterized protein n=1 Tax=Paenibacillus plantiphilus TaxID=2905650 RepID=A0ABM9C1N8_9BACL|nr:hypothetical protein PAECIP111893_01364 [Paenibacillus plantiphilus]